MIVKELPTFWNGMCYVIECKIPFHPINSDQLQLMWITVEKNSDIKEVDVRLTSQYEYLSITHSPRFDYNRPYMITVPFGNPRKQRILAIENEIQNLNCEDTYETNSQYQSFEQCLVDLFVFSDFLQCPTKCVPIQMKGFKYLNESVDLKHCTKLDDEICNGGPNVWKMLKKSYLNCPMPCKQISYGSSNKDLVGSLFNDANPNEAIFEIEIMDKRIIATEVLLYDTNDMIGAIGGSLGLFLGFSFFHFISKCVEKLLELFFVHNKILLHNLPQMKEV